METTSLQKARGRLRMINDPLPALVKWGALSTGECLLFSFFLTLTKLDSIIQELLALGEVVGNESRGLSADSIASLPSVMYKEGSSQSGSNDS